MSTCLQNPDAILLLHEAVGYGLRGYGLRGVRVTGLRGYGDRSYGDRVTVELR